MYEKLIKRKLEGSNTDEVKPNYDKLKMLLISSKAANNILADQELTLAENSNIESIKTELYSLLNNINIFLEKHNLK